MALRAAPVTMDFLRGPASGLSKALGSLRKHPNPAVAAAAKAVVTLWLDRAKASQPAGAASAAKTAGCAPTPLAAPFPRPFQKPPCAAQGAPLLSTLPC